jgi:hypothetical protein
MRMLKQISARVIFVAIIAIGTGFLLGCSDDTAGVQEPSGLKISEGDEDEFYCARGYITNSVYGQPLADVYVEAWWGEALLGYCTTNYTGHYWCGLGEPAFAAKALITLSFTKEGYTPHYYQFTYGYGYPTYWYNVELIENPQAE